MLRIIPIGGYKEIGRNCVAIKVDDEVIILDLGLHMDNYIEYANQDRESDELNPDKLMEVDAVPNIDIINDLQDNVEAVCVTHAHLDHAGAVPYLSNNFKADIHCTEFTANFLKAMTEDEGKQLHNDIQSHDINGRFTVTDKIDIEFIHVTHSTPQTVMIAVHTPYGTVLYANDFKLDNVPTLGPRTNTDRLKELNVKTLICDSLYADKYAKTPSESIAKEMLKDVLLGTSTDGKSVIVTTFSSHIARLKSIIKIGQMLNRKIVFMGRSIEKYVRCAEQAGIVNFTDKVKMIKYGSEIKQWLYNLDNPEDYLMAVTGNQGEENSTLGKMVYGNVFDFEFEDHVVFSCRVIPVEVNEMNRERMENELRKRDARIFRDIHVSGHAAREDLRELLHMVEADHFIPTHGDLHKLQEAKDLATDIGYDDEHVHILANGQRLKID